MKYKWNGESDVSKCKNDIANVNGPNQKGTKSVVTLVYIQIYKEGISSEYYIFSVYVTDEFSKLENVYIN